MTPSGPTRVHDANAHHQAGNAPVLKKSLSPVTPSPAAAGSALRRLVAALPCRALAVFTLTLASAAADLYVQRETWVDTMLATRAALHSTPIADDTRSDAAREIQAGFDRDFPMAWDWWRQDSGRDRLRWFETNRTSDLESTLIQRVLASGELNNRELGDEWRRLRDASASIEDPAWLRLYTQACVLRRNLRLAALRQNWPRIVFAKHYNLGGSHYAYTEGQSDAQHERTFVPGAALCVLEFDALTERVRTLIDDPRGVVRDPDVSWDGRRILFSWKRSDRDDDFHLYEYDLEASHVRQITSGLGFADYEGAYLPSGDLMFNSTRCVQTVDCWWTEVSNLYTCDRDGGRLRRLTFDQVHDNFPTVMPDGRILYTRWEYSDRGQIFVQGLFQMHADGTGQTEFYGNSSWFPTALLHARGIPKSQEVVAVFSGHHTLQVGKLGIINPARGRQENQGARLIAPLRETAAERIDAYGQEGELFAYPYPLSATEFLVSYAPDGWAIEPALFKLYWFHADGRRELLASDPDISCHQAIPLAPRATPPERQRTVDSNQDTGVFALQDVYAGPGLEGVPRGTVKKLRVIALNYRPAGIGQNFNAGPAGDALVSTPIAVGNGAWDVKIVLGDADLFPDGSACFKVPARTPVYFQAIDDRGCAVQTMRSWSTLQPGEIASCVGCHEPKNQAPLTHGTTPLAARAGPQPMAPFHGQPRGFSFQREIQPILDRHCVRCHSDSVRFNDIVNGPADAALPWAAPGRNPAEPVKALSLPLNPSADAGQTSAAPPVEVAFSLKGDPVTELGAGRRWTEGYLALAQARWTRIAGEECFAGVPTSLVNWISAQSAPDLLPPYHRGAACSRLMDMLAEGHHGVALSRMEFEKIACWIDLLVPFCGDYAEANTWTAEEQSKYVRFLEKRRKSEKMTVASD